VATSIRRIAVAELEAALAAIAGNDTAKAAHAVRQRVKRLRALIRLPHGHFAAYRRQNTAFRDLGRRLAGTREAEVLGKTYDDLVGRAGLEPPPELRERLLGHHPPRLDAAGQQRLLTDELGPMLRRLKTHVAGWGFEASGFSLIAHGVENTYRQMRTAGLAARHETNAANLHEWRKQVKYHAAQLKMLADVAPAELKVRERAADELADVLGEHHDLDVLRAALDGLPTEEADGRRNVIEGIEARSGWLETEAFRLGDQLAGEDSPAAFRRRLAAAWKVWRG
jgi:CHAD domain-containing protein